MRPTTGWYDIACYSSVGERSRSGRVMEIPFSLTDPKEHKKILFNAGQISFVIPGLFMRYDYPTRNLSTASISQSNPRPGFLVKLM